jgi:hypothetical protein
MMLVAVSVLSLLVPAGHAAELVPKQLAGPPEEFAQMRAPDPGSSAILSKSALLPVELAAQAGGAQWRGSLPVESGRARFMVLDNGAGWQAVAGEPGVALRADATNAAPLQAAAATLGMQASAVQGVRYALDGTRSGEWTLQLRASTPQVQRGYLLMEGDERTQLASYPHDRQRQTGRPLALNAVLAGNSATGETRVGLDAGRIERAELRVIAPDGNVSTTAMADDGFHDDGAAGDGVYGGSFVPDHSGTWIAQTVVYGRDRDGQSFVRTAEHVLPVLDAQLRVAGGVGVQAEQDGRLTLRLPVVARGADVPSHYRVLAEVWGKGSTGEDVPVAWIGGMTSPVDGRLTVALDERWITRSGARAPFVVRNLRIEDPDHFVPLVEQAELSLALPATRLRALASANLTKTVAIDEAMRVGPRPASLLRATSDATVQATGSRLVLVHGYCSSGVWPVAQFSNASAFLDTNQSRSNDQFAQLLAQFGSQWNSFGTVAHSQGGMAALHLYAYYWSGLDNASGARLLQSVGTPYQGTNLAGILATVGSWFGVGCGSNTDLTYDGARAWLAGIPASARAKVFYYTTSFASTNWWTNDYCNAASDLVLSDPEDGTVERVNAQLPSGNNMGHTTGQCHTTGMRDPAQYLDASRNATMSANAAR